MAYFDDGSSNPNKMIAHPAYTATTIVYCDKFQIENRDEIHRTRTRYVQVVGLCAEKRNVVEIICFEHIAYTDPDKDDMIAGINNICIPTPYIPELMALVQLAYVRISEVRSGNEVA